MANVTLFGTVSSEARLNQVLAVAEADRTSGDTMVMVGGRGRDLGGAAREQDRREVGGVSASAMKLRLPTRDWFLETGDWGRERPSTSDQSPVSRLQSRDAAYRLLANADHTPSSALRSFERALKRSLPC